MLFFCDFVDPQVIILAQHFFMMGFISLVDEIYSFHCQRQIWQRKRLNPKLSNKIWRCDHWQVSATNNPSCFYVRTCVCVCARMCNATWRILFKSLVQNLLAGNKKPSSIPKLNQLVTCMLPSWIKDHAFSFLFYYTFDEKVFNTAYLWAWIVFLKNNKLCTLSMGIRARILGCRLLLFTHQQAPSGNYGPIF